MTRKLLYFLFFIVVCPIYSQNQTLSEQASVSILTCGGGAELYTTFGHTAIRIKDIPNQLDVVYNYGMFDFREGNFYLKFVKGDLKYFMGASRFDDFIYEYQNENRTVIEQTLNLSHQQKQYLFETLNTNLFSDDRYYTYKFIDKNCTTMAVEKINKTLDHVLIKKVGDTTLSYRKVLYPYFQNHFWYKLGINIMFGAKTDGAAEKLFLPIEFLNSLDKAKINGKPLVAQKEVLIQGAKIDDSFSVYNTIYFVAFLLFILCLLNQKKIFLMYLVIAGMLGMFLCLVGLYSLHKELLWNYNALLFNPLYLLLPFSTQKKWGRKLLYVCLVGLGIFTLLLLDRPHFILMMPFTVATTYMLFRLQQTKL